MQKNLFKYIALLIAVACVFYFFNRIQNSNQQMNDETPEEVYSNTLPDDFHDFYNQYHTDSIFQLNRTMFPLKGLARSQDSTKIAEEVLWQKDEWILHKPFDSHQGTFERTFTNFEGIITESITANQGLFSLEKRYAKLGNEWHLIYYQELLMNG